jgi:hypothetical protein
MYATFRFNCKVARKLYRPFCRVKTQYYRFRQKGAGFAIHSFSVYSLNHACRTEGKHKPALRSSCQHHFYDRF